MRPIASIEERYGGRTSFSVAVEHGPRKGAMAVCSGQTMESLIPRWARPGPPLTCGWLQMWIVQPATRYGVSEAASVFLRIACADGAVEGSAELRWGRSDARPEP